MAAIYALGGRGDATAVPALEALLKSDDLSIEMMPMIKGQIARLKKAADGKPGSASSSADTGEESAEYTAAARSSPLNNDSKNSSASFKK